MMFPATLSAVARAATPAIAALVAAGIDHEVVSYQHDPRNESFGDEAVAQLAADGIVAEQVFKTLVIALPKGLAVAVVPVPQKLSLKAAAAALGVPKAEMADPAAAQRVHRVRRGRDLPAGPAQAPADSRRHVGAGLRQGALQRRQTRPGRRAVTGGPDQRDIGGDSRYRRSRLNRRDRDIGMSRSETCRCADQ